MDNPTADNEGESMETQIHAVTESEERQDEEDLERQEVEGPPPGLEITPARPSTGKTCSGAEARPKSKMARLQSLTEAVKAVRKVQETLANTDSLSENEAFGKFVTAALNKLPPAASVMAQGDIQQILQKYRLDSLTGNASVSLASGCSSQISTAENLSWDSSPATTPHQGAYSNQFQRDEDENETIGNIITEAWNLTNE